MRFFMVFMSILMHMLLGAMWYGPILGTTFLALAHPRKSPDQIEMDSKAFLACVVGAVVAMPIFALFLELVSPPRMTDGMLWGVIFGLFDAGMHMPHGWFEDRPPALYWIHQGYHLISYVVNGALLTAYP